MGPYLDAQDSYLEAEDFDEDFWSASDIQCTSCDTKLCFRTQKDDAIEVTLCSIELRDGALDLTPVLDDPDPFGRQDYLVDPLYFCQSCWEEFLEETEEQVRDRPPAQDPSAPLICSCCHDALYYGEYVAYSKLGHMEATTAGNKEFSITDGSGADVVCLACLARMREQDSWLELWEVSQQGECNDCQRWRCWRMAGCRCPCHQHR